MIGKSQKGPSRPKKITLSRTTVRALTPSELVGVAGGATKLSRYTNCECI